LRGTKQTEPGKASKLKLTAKQGGVTLATGAPFTVSSIPQNYSDTFVSLVTVYKGKAARGIKVQDGWESDSGTFADLDKTEIREQVEPKSESGCFTNGAPSRATTCMAIG